MSLARPELAEQIASSMGRRFEVMDSLGVGGIGVVYRAHDRSRRIDVALKTLQKLDGSSLYRFKNEFRALTGIVHENLVKLYELLSAGGVWFFTMELVDGTDLMQYVRPHRPRRRVTRESGERSGTPGETPGEAPEDTPEGEDDAELTGPTATIEPTATIPPEQDDEAATSAPVVSRTRETDGSEDSAEASRRHGTLLRAKLRWDRFARAMCEIVSGVRAIHHAGKLHRDLKPSNVLVDRSGRVVVCDFGLIEEMSAERDETPGVVHLAGTPVYMSPEQAAGVSLTEASDWYSVGVMMYRALSGRLPFPGPAKTVLRNKQTLDPMDVQRWDESIPNEWSALTMALLRREPSARPTGKELFDTLTRLKKTTVAPARAKRVTAEALFVGREEQLHALHEALAATREGHPAAVLIRGNTGLGKTALAERFLAEAQEDPEVLVLRARCYQRETVPYKALDTLVDALSEHLLGLPAEERRSLLPEDFAALERIFPVMGRVAVATDIDLDVEVPRDHQGLREKAFAALAALVDAIARQRPTILFIDDLHWGDLDSAPFIADLLHHPDRPTALFLATHRLEHEQESPFLSALEQTADRGGTRGDVRHLEVGPLPVAHAEQLVRRVVGDSVQLRDRRVSEIVADARGNPFFITELARGLREGGQAGRGAGTLDEMLYRRISELPEEAHAVLTAAVVAARPVTADLLSRATGIRDEAAALSVLEAQRLVRFYTDLSGAQMVEPYHSRVRETAATHISERDARRVHRRIARAYEASTLRDPQALVEHWLGAGDESRAGDYALQAARQAERAMAFERAAHHYRLALDLLKPEGDERRKLETLLGDMLACSGNLSAAAQAYLDAAAGAERGVSLELRRRAAEQLLRAGRLNEGLDLTKELLRAVGMRMPKGGRRAMLSIVASRLRMALRGRRFQARSRTDVPPEELWRIDVCFSAASSMNIANPLVGSALAQKYVLSALRTGDAYRSALAVGNEVGFRATKGPSVRPVIEGLIREAEEILEKCDDPFPRGAVLMAIGVAHFLLADWRNCVEVSTEGQEYLTTHCADAGYFRDQCTIWRHAGLVFLGRLGEVAGEVPVVLRKASEQGNEYLANALRSWRSNIVWLVRDQPDEAQSQLAEVTSRAQHGGGFHIYNYYWMHASAQIALYREDARAAWDHVSSRWKRMTGSVGMRVHTVRVEAILLRARCALAMATRDRTRADEYLRVAESSAHAIDKERTPWTTAVAALIRANIAALRKDDESAAKALEAAIEGFAEVEMAALGEVARVSLGRLRGGDAGQEMVDSSTAWLREQTVAAPERYAAMYAPAFFR